ncbi:MAG: holin [Clostridia bacterium]|nr:holin [Clostridia bacterium]
MEVLKEYLVVTIILICLVVGYILKNIVTTDKINKFISLIMAVLGVILSLWMHTWTFTPDVLLAGLISGLASSGAYDGFKGIKEYFGDITDKFISSEKKNE